MPLCAGQLGPWGGGTECWAGRARHLVPNTCQSRLWAGLLGLALEEAKLSEPEDEPQAQARPSHAGPSRLGTLYTCVCMLVVPTHSQLSRSRE